MMRNENLNISFGSNAIRATDNCPSFQEGPTKTLVGKVLGRMRIHSGQRIVKQEMLGV